MVLLTSGFNVSRNKQFSSNLSLLKGFFSVKVIILAAGRGIRFNRRYCHSRRIPKCLIPIREKDTILDCNLGHLLSEPIVTGVVIITGFQSGCINEHIANRFPDNGKIQIIYNHNFKHPVIFSLQCALNNLEPHLNLLILNGDTWYKRAIFQNISTSIRSIKNTVMLFGAKTTQFKDDDMRVVTHHNRVINVGKFITNANAISAGAILLLGEGVTRYRHAVFDENAHTLSYHHSLLHTIIKDGYPVHFGDIGSQQWVEIDTYRDLEFL